MLYQLLLLGIIGRLAKAGSCSTSDTVALTALCDCSGDGSDDCDVRFFFSSSQSIIGSSVSIS